MKNFIINLFDIIKFWIKHPSFDTLVSIVIITNAIVLGMETSSFWIENFGPTLYLLDTIFLSFFVLEIFLKMCVLQKTYFKDPWSYFDITIVGISILAASPGFSALRALRILRTLRMITVVPSLKKVVVGLLEALPGIGSVFVIISILFYVGTVMSTHLFMHSFPEWFGSLTQSAYSLFQIMTLESWSMGIVRPVMDVYPWAPFFFIPFIIVTTFTMLNLFIAVIVNSLNASGDDPNLALLKEIAALKSEVVKMRESLEKKH